MIVSPGRMRVSNGTELRTTPHDGSYFQWQLAATDPNVGDYPAGFATARTPLIGERGRLPGVDSRWSYTARMNGKDAGASRDFAPL